eukprot:TRINITY_DN37242_c0_g1_i1.p1 TRINITY_DN37242_c0_g1~~TRINITY_DN37242_c0_g1_i1.p1  ORF type:complete len:103 (+),score=9.12 TRINITY_DN37242_c0_g1_i1:488-796(+)
MVKVLGPYSSWWVTSTVAWLWLVASEGVVKREVDQVGAALDLQEVVKQEVDVGAAVEWARAAERVHTFTFSREHRYEGIRALSGAATVQIQPSQQAARAFWP